MKTIAVSNLHYSKIENGKATVTFHVNTKGDVTLKRVMNHSGAEKGYLAGDE